MTTIAIERPALTLTADQLKKVRQALQSLTLCHSQAPESNTALRNQTVFVGEDTEGTFELLSPQQTGKTSDYLVDFFNKDQKQAWSTEFDHRLIAEGSEEYAMHCHTLSIKAKHFIPSGIDSDEKRAAYCLFARNTQGRITSFIRFSVSLGTFEDIFGEYDPETDEGDIEDAIRFYLNVHFDGIYTRARFRGRGGRYGIAVGNGASSAG